MTDSMKFGPEWLRNLSGDSCNTTTGGGGGTITLSTPRYHLAEYRYGREEMLALYDRNCKPPELLTTFSALYMEKTQLPLALVQMTEDETRMWNGGIANIGGRGRGSSVDRGGRGRGGRGNIYSHYSRGVGFDDSGDGMWNDGQSFQGRNRFDRSQSERGWSERNGTSDSGEWNGSSSPRKELSRGTSGSSLMESNWRRHRTSGEDDDGWRKWGRNSWRESGSMDRDRLDRNEGDGDESRSGPGRWEHRGNHRSSHDSGHHPPPPRTARTWESNHDNHDNLPEWATENLSESGGSFDATGAFHGTYSDDDEDGVAGASQHSRTRRVSEGSASNIVKSNNNNNNNNNTNNNKPLAFGTGSVQSLNRHTSNTLNRETTVRSKPLHLFESKGDSTRKDRRCNSPTAKPVTVSSTECISAKASLTTSSDLLQKKAVRSEDKVEDAKMQPSDVRSNESSTAVHNKEKAQVEVKTEPIVATSTTRPVPLHPEPPKTTVAHNTSTANSVRQKTEDDLDRMKEEADALVAKLMADEESHKEKSANVPPAIGNQPSTVSATDSQEKWFYRDPQGEVQGPFLASEMAEWFKAGYFTAGLLVRRTCDERYYTLGDLIKICGRVPFIPGPSIPPLKLSEQVIPPPVPSTVPAGLAAAGTIPKTGIDDPLLLLQYQQMQLLQNQQLLLRQMRTSAIAKLSQSEHWANLSPVEQNQLILQYVVQDSDIPDVPISTNPFVPHLTPQTAANPVMQLFTQMQQAKTQPETHLPTNPHTTAPALPTPVGSVDPIQQLIQQMGGMQNLSTVQQPNITPPTAPAQDDNPIKSLLRQLSANNHPQKPHMDVVWPQPPPQMAAQFNAQNWLAQVGPIPAMPPGHLPGSPWDVHAKEMKTEQQILEEQNLKLQEDRKKEELRKQEELQRQAEEETVKRKQKEEQARQAEEARRKDEERKRKEEEKKLKEEEKRKQEEEQKKREEKKRKEEEKKREEKRKQEEENLKKKQEEEKKKREELRKLEEKQKKEEEKKRKLEEELRRQEGERLRKEAETRRVEAETRRLEALEQVRRAEQRRREAEALRKLQERSKAPWAQAPRAPTSTGHASLAEIQRLEREKKAEEQRLQQLMQQQLAQQKTMEAAQEASATDSSKRLQFKWAEKAIVTGKPLQVKSLAQIQQEEQEHIAKEKERERQEKAGQKESANMLQNAGIWSTGTASQCLNWANSTQTWPNNTTGFWDDPTPVRSSVTSKQPAKQAVTTKSVPNQQQQQHQHQQHQQPSQQQQTQQQNNKASKNKSKRDEEVVKKLFEQNTAKTDEFTQWCSKALSGIQASVDIPTFVGFLRDIESAYEVKEYVRIYLGDNKQSTEFAKQFLEKRSKWRSAQRPQAQADDLCKPAPAVNPNAPAEFQEVKGKSKKPKKGKMFKVDNRILGFSVTAAPDRINVGDRDYGEGV